MLEKKKKVLEEQIKLVKELKEGDQKHPCLITDLDILENELKKITEEQNCATQTSLKN